MDRYQQQIYNTIQIILSALMGFLLSHITINVVESLSGDRKENVVKFTIYGIAFVIAIAIIAIAFGGINNKDPIDEVNGENGVDIGDVADIEVDYADE